VVLVPGVTHAAESAAGIRLSGFSDKDLPVIRRFVDDALRTVRRYATPVKLPADLEFTAQAAIARIQPNAHYLPPDIFERRRRMLTVLWLLHIRPHTGHVSEETVPYWLIAASDWLVDQPLDTTPVALLRYPYTEHYLKHDQLPSVIQLAKHPVPTRERTLYPLYAESCAVALLCLVRNNDKAMINFMRLYDDRRPLEQNLNHLLPAFFRDGLRLKQWYKREVTKLVTGSDSMLTVAESDALRQRYETISAAPAGVLESQARRIPLDEIHLHMPKWRITKRVVSDLQRRFLELRQRSHPILRPAITQYVAAIPRFQAVDRTVAVKQLAAARLAFKDAMLRARQYEARLDAVEASTTAGTASYRSPLPLVKASAAPLGPATRRIEEKLERQ
jgi:hypothetical protein